MLNLAPVTRVASGTALLLALASACGGQSFKNGGDEPEAGSAGVSTRAGSGSGGSSAKAGSAGTSPGGAGSIPGEPCSGPPILDSAGCSAYFQRWFHDDTTGLCVPFIYGGCSGTPNNYETLEACQAACPGGTPNYDACEAPSDCMLGDTGCCGVCDGLSVSKHDFRAYNKKFAQQASACPDANVACGPCPPPEGGRTLQYFIPNCVNRQCVVEDIRETDVTTCNSTQDCQLRNGTGCCEGCGDGQWVSVRNDGSLEKLVCGDTMALCDECAAVPPSDARVSCHENRCGIVYLLK